MSAITSTTLSKIHAVEQIIKAVKGDGYKQEHETPSDLLRLLYCARLLIDIATEGTYLNNGKIDRHGPLSAIRENVEKLSKAGWLNTHFRDSIYTQMLLGRDDPAICDFTVSDPHITSPLKVEISSMNYFLGNSEKSGDGKFGVRVDVYDEADMRVAISYRPRPEYWSMDIIFDQDYTGFVEIDDVFGTDFSFTWGGNSITSVLPAPFISEPSPTTQEADRSEAWLHREKRTAQVLSLFFTPTILEAISHIFTQAGCEF